MAEDIAARWMGSLEYYRRVQWRLRLGNSQSHCASRSWVTSHICLMNGVGIQVLPDRIVEVGEEDAIALTARGFQRL